MGHRLRCPLAVLALLVAGCAGPPRRMPPDPAEIGRSLRSALVNADLAYAERVITMGRQLHPEDVGLLFWSAAIHRMSWRFDDAVADLRDAYRQATGDAADLRRRIAAELGVLLFLAGRYAEARPWLIGAGDASEPLCSALRGLLDALPFQRADLGDAATELPLLGTHPPELLCRIGAREVPLALDTGASWTTLTRSFADRLGLVRRGEVLTAHDAVGTELPARAGVAPQLQLGTLELGAVPVLVVEAPNLELPERDPELPDRPRGVVGFDVLSRFRFTLDPERASILLGPHRPLEAPRVVRCVRSRGGALVPVKIESRRLWFLLDTGASHSSLTAEGLAELPGGAARALPVPARRIRFLGGERVAVRAVPALSLQVSAARFPGVELPVVARAAPPAGAPPDAAFPVHGVLGADLLLRCRATFDSGRLLLESAH